MLTMPTYFLFMGQLWVRKMKRNLFNSNKVCRKEENKKRKCLTSPQWINFGSGRRGSIYSYLAHYVATERCHSKRRKGKPRYPNCKNSQAIPNASSHGLKGSKMVRSLAYLGCAFCMCSCVLSILRFRFAVNRMLLCQLTEVMRCA